MKVIDLIHSNKKTAFSFEILPPLKGTGIEKLYQTIDTLREFDPKYINITTHRSEYVYKDLGNGLFQRNRLRRRPGTVAVAAAIQNKYNITVVPHILCSGFTREETEYVLLDLQFLNITELLVLRGDKAKHESVFTPEGDGYHHAIELQEQINNFNKGIFVDGSEMKVTASPFSYGVACYPEKHEEAPNIESDLYWLKKKVEAGAEYAIMEVSSQALKLHRVDGCDFDIGVFTNFSEDHISEKEHPDMKDYFESKLKLFKMCDNGIINVDDLQVSKIPRLLPENKIMTYGIDNYCEVLAKDITITNSYVDFRVKGLRKKACYDIPSATGRGDYKPALKPDVVKLEVIPDHQNPGIPTVESTMLPLEEPCPAIEVMLGTVSIKISNDVDPKLLSQILKAVTGTC